MSSVFLIASLMTLFVCSQAQQRPILKLWPSGNPEGWTRTDKETTENNADGNLLLVKGVSQPTLEIFRSTSANPDAPTVLICPGGGYYVEAIEHEGWEIASRLNLAGIHTAVLKYRLPNRDSDKPLHKVVLQDTQRAIRLLRAHAAEYKMRADRVGILGFSAGGHAAAVTSTASAPTYTPIDDADKMSPRPDFTVLVYPAYLNKEGTTQLTEGLVVDKNTPPAFLLQTMDDPLQVEGCLAYTHACHKAQVSIELHLFPKGGHGYGLRTHEPGLEAWPDLLIAWMRRLY